MIKQRFIGVLTDARSLINSNRLTGLEYLVNRTFRFVLCVFLLQSGCESVDIPIVTTSDVNEITFDSAKSGGRISSDGGGDIISRGIVWDTLANPTIERNVGMNDKGSGARLFFLSMDGLEPGTKYYVRAFAANTAGTAYGDAIEFTTRVPVETVEENSLVLSFETKATVDLIRTAYLVNGAVFKNKVVWENFLYRYNIPVNGQSPLYSATLPSEVILQFSLSSSGTFSMKAKCPSSPESLFSLLSFRKYMTSDPMRVIVDWTTLKKPVPSDYYTKAVDPLLMTCPFQAIMSYEFGFLSENYGILSGPANYYDFGQEVLKTFSLKSGFSKPVFYVFSMVHHIQTDYPGYNMLLHEIDRYYNSRYSMAPLEQWNLDFTGKRYSKISVVGKSYSLMFVKLVGENKNFGYVKINNISQADLTGAYSRESYNFFPPDNALLEISLTSSSAQGWAAVCYITCADALTVSDWSEERDEVINPSDSWDKNPKPLVFKIDRTGLTELK